MIALYIIGICLILLSIVILLFIVFSGPNLYKKSKDTGSWQLLIKCHDGFWESQGYDTYEEATQAGNEQLDGEFVIDYKINFLSNKALYLTHYVE